MREIKFRGKSIITKEWIYGNLQIIGIKSYIFNDSQYDSPDHYEVISETIGQYIGRKDRFATKICEGDIVYVDNELHSALFPAGVFKVEWQDIEAGFYLISKNLGCRPFDESSEYTIIGNIHDHPELLEEK